MKKNFLFLEIIALIAVVGFGMVACDSNDTTLKVGDTGPGGGKIFYYSAAGFTMTDDNQVCHYLEAAPADMPTFLAWASLAHITPAWGGTGEWANVSGTGTGIGAGRKNTALILVADADAPAAKACNEYSNGGKTDWFLPSKDELNELYKNKASVGTFQDVFYSSSSQSTSNDGISIHMHWRQTFYTGVQNEDIKHSTLRVRAVRAFE